MEFRLAEYKDVSFNAQDEHIEQTTVNGNTKQTVHIIKSAQLQRENLIGRKIAFDEILSYIKEAGEKYENMRVSKKRKKR